ncbi:MAG: hypothetical protein IPK71_13590 [Myxococcales bacterium]|nr:hypothetical protein [Myxococcales bacterium]
MPKSLALRLLAPGLEARSHLLARQGALDVLVAELGQGRLHAVLSDEPAPEGAARRVFSHLLGESTILLYAAPALARVHRRSFPDTLASAPFLLPAQGQSLRRQIDRWLADKGLRVGIVGEFDDAGMMRVAGAAGMGLLPVRAALRAEVEDAHAMEFVGHLDGLVERYYVLSSERRTRHRAVTRIVEQAREGLAHTPGKKVAARPAPHSPKRRR